MGFSFEGDAIAIYGTAGVEIGDYVVTLDGQSRTFNGGSKGSVRIPHDQVSGFWLTKQLITDRLFQTILVSEYRGRSWGRVSHMYF